MRGTVAARAYRGFVRLYPRPFREEYGDDLVALFEEQCRDESPVRVSLRAAVDLLVTVPIRHLEEPMGRRAPTTTTLFYVALALGGVVLVGSVLVGARLGVDAWHLGMALLLAGLALVLAGLALGLGRLFRRRAPLAG